MANVKDGATSTIATAPSPATSGTSLVVQSGGGALFPAAPFYAIVHSANSLPTTANAEKVLVTAKSTDTFTIVRTQGDYTTPRSIAVGWRISNAIFQEDMNNSSIIQNEVPGGTVNGSNTAFTVASAAGMLTGSLRVYQNGIRLKGGGEDFTQTSTGFTMVTAPLTGDLLLVDYNVNGALNNVGTNSIITGEVPAGTINGTNKVFTLPRPYIGGSVEAFVNGVSQLRPTHFVETSPSLGTITFDDAPLTGDVVHVNYQFNLNPASNADTVDGIHASSTPTANQLVALDSSTLLPASVQRPIPKKLNTTSSSMNSPIIEVGSGGVTNGSASNVTFQSTFTSIPIVVVNGVGGNAGSSAFAYPTANGTAFNDRTWSSSSQSTTGFTANISGTAVSSSNMANFTWIAIGN